MEEALLDVLGADSDVVAVLAARIWWGRAPQKEPQTPYAVMTRIGGDRDVHLGGASGLVESAVQIDVWGETYGAAKLAARAVATRLAGYRGGDLQGVYVDTERDLPDTSATGEPLFRVSLDLTIWHDDNT